MTGWLRSAASVMLRSDIRGDVHACACMCMHALAAEEAAEQLLASGIRLTHGSQDLLVPLERACPMSLGRAPGLIHEIDALVGCWITCLSHCLMSHLILSCGLTLCVAAGVTGMYMQIHANDCMMHVGWCLQVAVAQVSKYTLVELGMH